MWLKDLNHIFIVCLGLLSGTTNAQSLSSAQLELGQKLASEHLLLLGKNSTSAQNLINNRMTASQQCPSHPSNFNCHFLIKLLPMHHQSLRQLLALSRSQDPYSWQLFKLSDGGNPRMIPPPFLPIKERWEPLTKDEEAKAQATLTNFGIATVEKYVDLLNEKIQMFSANRGKGQLHKISRTLAKFKNLETLDSTTERLKQALLIGDPAWHNFARNELHQAQLQVSVLIWTMIEQIRPLIYLPQAKPTASQVEKAIQLFQQDIVIQTEYIQTLGDRLDKKDSSSESALKVLLEYDHFFADVITKSPHLEPTLLKLLEEHHSAKNLRTNLIVIAGLSPLVLLFPPAAAGLGPWGSGLLMALGTGALGIANYDAIIETNKLNRTFLSHWDLTKIMLSHDDNVTGVKIQTAQMNQVALQSLTLVTLGLPIIKLSMRWYFSSHLRRN